MKTFSNPLSASTETPAAAAVRTEAWCVAATKRVRHCPLCVQPAEVKLTVRGRPYLSCRACTSRLFLNTPRAAQFLAAADAGLARLAKAFHKALQTRYVEMMEFLESLANPKGSNPDVKPWMAPKMRAIFQGQHDARMTDREDALRKAGRACLLCGGPAEWRRTGGGKGKVSYYQGCRFCVSTLFVHSPLGLAGLVVRRGMLPALLRTGNPGAPIPPCGGSSSESRMTPCGGRRRRE